MISSSFNIRDTSKDNYPSIFNNFGDPDIKDH